MRDLACIDFVAYRIVGHCPEAPEQREHPLFVDQLARLLDSAGRVEAVVETDQPDLAPIDATFRVDLVEVGGLRSGNTRVTRERSAVGHGLADSDLGVRDPGTVIFRCLYRADQRRARERRADRG